MNEYFYSSRKIKHSKEWACLPSPDDCVVQDESRGQAQIEKRRIVMFQKTFLMVAVPLTFLPGCFTFNERNGPASPRSGRIRSVAIHEYGGASPGGKGEDSP